MKRKHNYKKTIINLLGITFGCLFYAAGIALFLDPNNIVPGGVAGIAMMINHYFNWETGTIILILNVPLLALGLWKFGKSFLFSTVYATVLSSILIDVVEYFLSDMPPLTDNTLLSGLAGGALMAIGMGIVFRFGATTGGADIIIKLIRRKVRHLKTGKIFLITDAAVITASAIVFQNVEIALYAAISLIVSSFVLDRVLYGADSASLLFIVSDKSDEIAQKLTVEAGFGVTFLNGVGAYTNKEKKVLLCAAKKRAFPQIKEIVKDIDEAAFMIVSSANEIFGEGFKPADSEEL